jgi:hypothetical protein
MNFLKMISYLRQKPILFLPIVLVIVLLFFYIDRNRQESFKRIAISHCADIEYVKYADSNPKLFITYDFADVIKEAEKREVALKKESLLNKKKRKDQIDAQLKKGISDTLFIDPTLTDEINMNLYIKLNSSIKSLEFDIIKREELHKYKSNYKIETFKNYEKFYRSCLDKFLSLKDKNEKEKFIEIYKPISKHNFPRLLEHYNEVQNKLINILNGYSETEFIIKHYVSFNKLHLLRSN